jgi:hypothetical protein
VLWMMHTEGTCSKFCSWLVSNDMWFTVHLPEDGHVSGCNMVVTM